MPWSEVTRMDERVRFVGDRHSGLYMFTELCERYGISRKTGYKWIQRYREQGVDGLKDRSRAAHRCPHRTPSSIQAQLVRARRSHPRWGPKKLVAWLAKRHPEVTWPALSTVGEILKRHGLVEPRVRRRRCWHPGRPVVEMSSVNDVWTVDFKGEFRMRDGQYCYPLTVVDGRSRYLLGCRARPSVSEQGSRPVFERLFRTFGLPSQILSDNGQPFASSGIGGLSKLSLWWVKLGIQPLRIERGHPEQNGRHERLHRTLKAETARPPRAHMAAQQQAFWRFRREYNEHRPHEALEQETPASIYHCSQTPYPKKLSPVEYPQHYEVRRVGPSGSFNWRSERTFLGKVFRGEDLGLKEIDDGIWSVYFGPLILGRWDERSRQMSGGQAESRG